MRVLSWGTEFGKLYAILCHPTNHSKCIWKHAYPRKCWETCTLPFLLTGVYFWTHRTILSCKLTSMWLITLELQGNDVLNCDVNYNKCYCQQFCQNTWLLLNGQTFFAFRFVVVALVGANWTMLTRRLPWVLQLLLSAFQTVCYFLELHLESSLGFLCPHHLRHTLWELLLSQTLTSLQQLHFFLLPRQLLSWNTHI